MEELNEMERLERNIVKRYNDILKTLLEEGDMKTLERVITDDEYRNRLMGEKSANSKVRLMA